MNRRKFLHTSLAGAAGASLANAFGVIRCSTRRDQLNILWLDAEDICPDIGCYGNPLVHTPHIDGLADEGAMYTNAFTASPVCSASRSAIFTGMYQTTIGAHHHRSHREDGYQLPGDVKVMTQYFRDAGYFVCRRNFNNPESRGKMDFNFSGSFEDFFDGTDWRQRENGQPFFAHVHFSETHRTFKHDDEHPIDPDAVDIPPYYPDHPITRLDWALYLETVNVLDKKVGQILQRLQDDGLAENTVVFFTGDHGRAMLRGKQWLYDGGIHVPLIVRYPGGRINPGTVEDKLVNSIDWAPTWMEIAGIETPEYMQGRSFLNHSLPDREFIFSARDRCDETDDRIRSVRSKQFKYIRNDYPLKPYTNWNAYKKNQYPVLTLMEVLKAHGQLAPEPSHFMAEYRPVEELYELETDPHEVNNLAEDPDYDATLREFRSRLDQWIVDTGDKGQMPEDPEVALYWDRFMRDRWEEWMEAKGFSPEVDNQEYIRWWEVRLKQMKNLT